MISSILALLIRFILLAAFTFGFVVLFEHGPGGFVDGAATEWRALVGTIEQMTGQGTKPVESGT